MIMSAILVLFYVHKALKMAIIKQARVNMGFNEWAVPLMSPMHIIIIPGTLILHVYTGYIMLTCTGSADCQYSSKCDC